MDFMEPDLKGFLEDGVWLYSWGQRPFFTDSWHDVYDLWVIMSTKPVERTGIPESFFRSERAKITS